LEMNVEKELEQFLQEVERLRGANGRARSRTMPGQVLPSTLDEGKAGQNERAG